MSSSSSSSGKKKGISFSLGGGKKKLGDASAGTPSGARKGNRGRDGQRSNRTDKQAEGVEFLSSFDDARPLEEVKKEKKKDLVIPLQNVNAWIDPREAAKQAEAEDAASVKQASSTSNKVPAAAEERFKQALEGKTRKETEGHEVAGTGAQPSETEDKEQNKTLEQRAIDAILSSKDGTDSKEIEAIPLLMRNRAPGTEEASNEDERFRMDVAQRPKESSIDDYERVPVDQFGAAMLRGMGWKEGEAIGGTFKGLVEPIEYVPRMNRLGLGATRDLELKPDYKHRQKQYIKPGEKRKETTQAAAKLGADGKVRNIKRTSEQLYEQEVVRMQRGAYVFITGGAHEGHAGKIRRLHNLQVDVQLALSGAVVTLDERRVKPVSSTDYRRRAAKLRAGGVRSVLEEQDRERRQRGREEEEGENEGRHGAGRRESRHGADDDDGRRRSRYRERGEKGDSGSGGGIKHEERRSRDRPDDGDGSAGDEDGQSDRSREEKREKRKKNKKHKKEKKKHKKKDKATHDRRGGEDASDGDMGSHSASEDEKRRPMDASGDDGRGSKRGTKSERSRERRQAEDRYHGGDNGHSTKRAKRAPPRIWVCPDIRVRVVSETYARGKHYNKKVRVMDVMSEKEITCISEDGTLLEGLRQRDLETIVPKRPNSLILVVRGQHRRKIARLLERQKKKEQVVVQLVDDDETCVLSFDDVSEYLEQDRGY